MAPRKAGAIEVFKKMNYPHIFQKIKIRGHEFKNRVVMGSMHTGLEEKNDQLTALAKFYETRAAGGVGLIITGGFSPNWTGRLTPFAGDLCFPWQVSKHRHVTEAVHRHGSKIFMQLLHAGRYSFHPWSASASSLKAPISPFKPRSLSQWGVQRTIRHFGRAAQLAEKAGYDGVEVMGSEGYFINQFLSLKTNRRQDIYGGSLENRARVAVEIVKEIRRVTRDNFIICFRISLMDLVENGNTFDEVIQIAKWLEAAGVDIFDSGIGWHEAKVPTIYLEVPRGQFVEMSAKLKAQVSIPVLATNRINMPDLGEKILAEGKADFISLARPFLADPDWVMKAERGESQLINTCIACNQACLDHIFQNKRATCLVNPLACYESEMEIKKSTAPKKVAVVGAGPAGLQAALTLAQRGHDVSIFEKRTVIGGQLQFAAKIPGKEEFHETIRYFQNQLARLKVPVFLSCEILLDLQVLSPEKLSIGSSEVSKAPKDLFGFDHIIDASGVIPRDPKISATKEMKVWNYQDFLSQNPKIEGPIVIVGGGPIAIDVAEKIIKDSEKIDFQREWGVDFSNQVPGGLSTALKEPSAISITLCQRSSDRIGAGLGKTSGWIHRDFLKRKKVQLLSGVQYKEITSEGLTIEKKRKDGHHETQILKAQTVITCAGQESSGLFANSESIHRKLPPIHPVGGVRDAKSIDAKRSIREAFELALRL